MSSRVSFNIGSYVNPVDGTQTQNAGSKKSIFAGDTPFGAKNNPLIDRKKQLAGKQAMKLITDAFARDMKASDSINSLKEQKTEVLNRYNGNKNEIKSLEDEKAALQEKYNVDPDSQEQKDLELLQKYQSYKNGAVSSEFTDEEKARLKELEGTTRTEYQARVLKLNDTQDDLRKENRQLEGQVQGLTLSIADSQVDRLKSKDMINADNAADKIMEAASKEAVGMLINDAKEAMEEKAEEAKEKGEKLAEAREKFEERLEESKEKRKEEQELLEKAGKAELTKTETDIKASDDNAVSKAQQDIQKVLADNNLIDEDIKGLKINLGF